MTREQLRSEIEAILNELAEVGVLSHGQIARSARIRLRQGSLRGLSPQTEPVNGSANRLASDGEPADEPVGA